MSLATGYKSGGRQKVSVSSPLKSGGDNPRAPPPFTSRRPMSPCMQKKKNEKKTNNHNQNINKLL